MRSTVAAAACLVGLAVGVVGDIIIQEPFIPVVPQSAVAPCTEQLESSEPPLMGAFVPQCDDTGQYEPLQCHGSTGYCWCVDTAGARISDEFGPSDEDAITRDDCVALRQQRLEETVSLEPTPATPVEDGDAADDENDGKLGLLFVLAFASLVVLPVVLWFVLRRACAKSDETGHRTSLVEDSDKAEQDDASDEEDRGSGRTRSDAAKSETTPLSRSSGS